MGRQIEKRKKETAEAAWFVVDVGSNRDDPEPFEVELLPMSSAEYQKVETNLGRIVAGAGYNPVKKGHEMVAYLFENRVIGCRGYGWKGGEGPDLSKGGMPLLEAIGFEDAEDGPRIIDSIVGAIRSRAQLEAGAKKA